MEQPFSRLIGIVGMTLVLWILTPADSFPETSNEADLTTLESPWPALASDISLASFQASALSEHELFLDAYVGQQTSLIFAITKSESRLLEFPGEDELIPVLNRLHTLASSVESNPDSLRVATDAMSLLLFGKLDDLLANCNHLIFSAKGVFNLLPLNLLLPREKDIQLSRVPSAAILMDLIATRSARTHQNRVRTLAVGANQQAGQATTPGANMGIETLERSYKNVTQIIPNGSGILPELELLGSFDLIHVAAQTVGNDSNTSKSAILLHPTNPDMMITASDLSGLQLDTQMVVLARCSSTKGSILSGEGVQSLASAFLNTGIPSVVIALWPVDDDATNFFMTAFYEGLSEGNNAAESLSFARKMCQNDPVFNLPSHWGAFVLVGDNETTIALEQKTNINIGRILAALLGVLVAVVILLRRTNKKSVS